MQGSGYRTISCQEVTGTVTVTGTKNNGQAYAGEHLYSGDDVQVAEASELVLLMDSDKYVYADENTHFDLEASGADEDSRIKINLYSGSELNDLQSKLGPNETYEVDTPNSTMSVRGTRFRMTVYDGTSDSTYTLLEVEDGEVAVSLRTKDGEYNGVEQSFTVGESALIKADYELSEFVLGEDGEAARHLDYENLPEGNVDRLIELLKESGEEGFETSGKKNGASEDENHVHEAGGWEVTREATCTEDGEKAQICSCGEVLGTQSIPATGHKVGDWETVIRPTCTEAGEKQRICSVCGEVIETASIPATGHQVRGWTTSTPETCTKSGFEEQHCALCGELLGTRIIPPRGHISGGADTLTSPKCVVSGYYEERCIYCGELLGGGSIPPLGHVSGGRYETSQPGCVSSGSYEEKCVVCGEIISSGSIAPLGHRPGSAEVLDPGTCGGNSHSVIKCQVCGELLEDIYTPVNHDWQVTNVTHETQNRYATLGGPVVGHDDVEITEYTCSICHDVESHETNRTAID